MGQADPVSFVYPQSGSRIFIPRDTDGQYQKVTLEAAHASKGSTLFWYLDHLYLGLTHDVHQILISLDAGWHRLTVVDDVGNSKSLSFYSEKTPQ